MSGEQAAPGFDEWCIVELLGHRRVAGRVREMTMAGAGFLRIDEPDGRTQLVSPTAVYALHPVDRDLALAVAKEWRTEPISRYELKRALEPAPEDDDPF